MNSDKNLNLSLEVTFIELRGARSIFSGSIGSGTAAVYFKVRALNEAGKTVAERKIKISPL